MQTPRPYAVFQPIPGQNPKPLFTVHAYSLEQARALVATKVAGEVIVRAQILKVCGFAAGPVTRDGASQ